MKNLLILLLIALICSGCSVFKKNRNKSEDSSLTTEITITTFGDSTRETMTIPLPSGFDMGKVFALEKMTGPLSDDQVAELLDNLDLLEECKPIQIKAIRQGKLTIEKKGPYLEAIHVTPGTAKKVIHFRQEKKSSSRNELQKESKPAIAHNMIMLPLGILTVFLIFFFIWKRRKKDEK